MTELKERIINKMNDRQVDCEIPFPKKNLLIEITNLCNNKCIFCYNDCMQRKIKFIDKNICERVLTEAYSLGMREVGFYVVGEPFLDKRLKYFVSYAKKTGYEYIYLTTNGILANLENVKELYDCGLSSIKYSINATNKDDYKTVHGTDNFEKVIKNLTDVFNWKTKKNKNLKVYVSFVTIDITNKKDAIKDLFSSICDEFVVMPAINQGGLIPDINKISIKDSSDLNGNLKFPCTYPFNSVIVTVEGYLTACCMDFENMLAYADLNNTSLKEAWNNSLIKEFRMKHLEKKGTGTICDNCIYNTKSKIIPLSSELCSLRDNRILYKSIKKINRKD